MKRCVFEKINQNNKLYFDLINIICMKIMFVIKHN